jgi:hypothetical protein
VHFNRSISESTEPVTDNETEPVPSERNLIPTTKWIHRVIQHPNKPIPSPNIQTNSLWLDWEDFSIDKGKDK